MRMNRDHPLNLQEQIEQVRSIGESSWLPAIAVVCACAGVLGIIGFFWLDEVTPSVFALFLCTLCGTVSLAVLANLPRFRRVARATRVGRRVRGELQLTVDRSDNEDVRYHGRMVESGAVWELEFTRPLGWEPRSGEWECELVFLADVRLPVMVQLSDGLLFTSDRTRRVYGKRA